MKRLLDTQIYLWYIAASRKLSKRALARIDEAEEVFVSAASIWEASLKAGLGKLKVTPDDLVDAIAASRFTELPVTSQHAARVAGLPPLHRDPFDRLLVAQAQHEQLRLLTTDEILAKYSDLVEVV